MASNIDLHHGSRTVFSAWFSRYTETDVIPCSTEERGDVEGREARAGIMKYVSVFVMFALFSQEKEKKSKFACLCSVCFF